MLGPVIFSVPKLFICAFELVTGNKAITSKLNGLVAHASCPNCFTLPLEWSPSAIKILPCSPFLAQDVQVVVKVIASGDFRLSRTKAAKLIAGRSSNFKCPFPLVNLR